MRTIGKIAKLRFPDRQSVGFGGAETILKTEQGFFRKNGVDNDKRRRRGIAQVFQGNITGAVFLIMQHGMAVEECASATVLTGNADFISFIKQSRVGHVFGKSPVQGKRAGSHFAPVVHNFADPRIEFKTFR